MIPDSANTLYVNSNKENKEIILLPIDLNRKGNFSDYHYLKEDLVVLGFGSKGLKLLNDSQKESILNDTAVMFYTAANVQTSTNEARNKYKRSWLINKLYYSKDLVMVFDFVKNGSGSVTDNLFLKMNLKAYHLIKWATQDDLNALSNALYQEYKSEPGFTFTSDNIKEVIIREFSNQTDDLNNQSSYLSKLTSKHNVNDVYYQNSCGERTITLHVYQNRNTTYFEYTTTQEVVEKTGLSLDNEPFVVFKKNNIWVKSELPINFLYNNGDCPTQNTVSKTEQDHFKEKIAAFIDFSYLSKTEKELFLIEQKVKTILDNPLYKNVRLKVNVSIASQEVDPKQSKLLDRRQSGSLITTSRKSFQNYKTYQSPEITLDIKVLKDGTINIANIVNKQYLKEYEDQWAKMISDRGLELKVSDLRKQVHDDIRDLAKANAEASFYKTFIQDLKVSLSDRIANYVEGIAATQKVAKHVWENTEVNSSIWHSKEAEHNEWPNYMNQTPVLVGALDGTIDEIMGLPAAIKQFYFLTTDPKQRETLGKVFTKEGFMQMLEGMKQEAIETVNDDEKLEHFTGKTTVSVATTLSGVGLLTKLGKADKFLEVLEEATKRADNLPSPKFQRITDLVKKNKRTVADEAELRKLVDDIGDESLNDAAAELLDLAELAQKQSKKFTWEEIKAFFKRGNDFNRKLRELNPPKYRFHEVTVEVPVKIKGKIETKRYRLDSYNKGTEIVSRKATDFDKIKLSTFEGYLKELKKKYPEGAKIVATDERIRGKLLKGKQKLEVPLSNKGSNRLKEFENLAKKTRH